MGRQAYAIAGGVIGAGIAFFATGGTATLQGYEAGFALGAAIGGVAGSYIDPILLQGNKIGDAAIQTAAEGGTRAMMFGQACVIATCVIARGNRQVVKTKTSNGKGSSGKTQNETVTWTFAIGLGEAIINSMITRIWQDETLAYDITSTSTMSDDDNKKFRAKFRYYDGAETQLPDADLQVFLGVQTPYFRGTAYVVFPNFDLTQTAERVPTYRFEVVQHPEGLDILNTLSVELLGNNGLTLQADAVTLSALQPGVTYLVDLYLQCQMESRQYTTITARVGDGGSLSHFAIATSATAPSPNDNIFKVEVSNPSQTYYLNAQTLFEGPHTLIVLDGVTMSRLPIRIAGGATVTITADPVDGAQGVSADQYVRVIGNTLTQFDDGASTPVSVGYIVRQIMARAGMDSADYDVSALDAESISGVCVQSSVSGADAINSIVQPFFYDPCEKDAVLIYVERGGDVLRVLTIDDLTEEPDATNRASHIEYPAKLSFFYQSPATGYATTKATAYRSSPQALSSGEGSVTAPITFQDSDTPAQIAQKLLKVMWAEAGGSFAWRVGPHCIDLLPTDVVALSLRGIVTRARISAIENNGDYIELTMLKDRQSAYTSQITGIPLPAPTKPQPTTMSKAVLAVLDISALQDGDDQLCYYTAISGSTGVWQGAQLQRSLDSGATWAPIGDITTDVTMGLLTAAVTAADVGYTDTTNMVTVQLFDSANDLVSYSDTTFLQEQGAIAVQLAGGTWEIMQYRDAVDNGSGSWSLSYLQRGRLNSVAGSHAIGALFVFLDTTVAKNAAQTAWLGGTLQHRAVSYGTSSEDATVVSTVYTGRSQIEWSPASGVAEYDGAWVYVHDVIPRWRFGTEVAPIISANAAGYRVTCSDGTHIVTADFLTGNSAHVDVHTIGTITSVTIGELNKITGLGDTLALTVVAATAGSLTPTAIVNGGGA